MEGTMDSRRLVLTRPTPRSVAPRRQKVVCQSEAVSVEPSVIVSEMPIAEQKFSKLTPIYKPSPVNTVAEISSPRVKGIEFIKVSNKAEYVKPTFKKPEATILQNDEPLSNPQETLVNRSLEFYDNNLNSIDLDLIESNFYNNDVAIDSLEAKTEVLDYQPINFVEQYFERSMDKPKITRHHKKLLPVVKQKITKVNRKHVYRAAALSALVGVVAFGGYLVTDSFFVNQEAKAVINQASSVAASPILTETASDAASNQTTATTQTAQTAATGSSSAVSAAGSSVPSDQPKSIMIPKLGINAAVVNVGLTSDGAVDTPKNIWNAAWYNGSAKPGNSGAVLIDGHSSATRGALFGNLDRLAAGDQIKVERGDGTVIYYVVAYTAIVNRNNVDMASMLKPYGSADKGLNIITCTGKWIDSEKTLENRALVYATQI